MERNLKVSFCPDLKECKKFASFLYRGKSVDCIPICKKRIRTERGSKYQMRCIKVNLKNVYPQKVVVYIYTIMQITVFMWISAQCISLLRCREHTTFPRVLRFYHLLHSRLLEECIDLPAPLCSERGLFHRQKNGCDFLCNAGDRDLHATRFGLGLDRQNRP